MSESIATPIVVSCALCEWTTDTIPVPLVAPADLQAQADRIVRDHYTLLAWSDSPHDSSPPGVYTVS